ncbi:ras-associating and dilute domain-containing protein [Latimeria chalumnae]|uniref:Ras association and DIL domains 2a n=1 Tax=Latimeria chalumnae TaxID=7897 RepID=M3XJN9_LATCH|nr:PREDICTED: ras-associating and dilute domain-containing protein-like isoform X2 [Latimeria chalumnae]|eukprot:XP_014351310.1 PREDICTED: ras-associating and dilute domain-containing protein-like isoform X2 [Latimeria chalumnae]
MFSEEGYNSHSKQALNFPVGLLIASPKRRLAKLGRKSSSGSLQSSSSDTTVHSAESSGVRQPARNKIKRHNNRLSTVFSKGRNFKADPSEELLGGAGIAVGDDPAELSTQVSAPGVLKIFGDEISAGAHYKSVLATPHSSAHELVKEALERYSLNKAEANRYVLCDVIGQLGEDNQWKTECFRVVGDNEKPLMLQSLWKPKEGFARRFEIQKKSSVEEMTSKEKDTVTAGINAQARKLQMIRARGTPGTLGEDINSNIALWRSVSEMNLQAKSKDSRKMVKSLLLEDIDVDIDKDAQCLETEKEETESSDDNMTQYSIHPPFEFPYFLLLQGYNYRQDFVIYVMSGMTHVFGRCSEHTTGDDEERLKVDILLSAPDILPRHCCVRRVESNVGCEEDGTKKIVTLVRPLHGAYVTHNGLPIKTETKLLPGDLLGLGECYIFMYKDPTVHSSTQIPVWLSSPRTSTCKMCCSMLHCNLSRSQKALKQKSLQRLKNSDGQDLVLQYDLVHEERLLNKIIKLTDPHNSGHRLIPTYLLCLCIQHSACTFELSDLRKLLLRIASQVQTVMWEKTKELAGRQPENVQLESEEVSMLSINELIPGLQPLVFWMSNSIELLHFIQQEVPKLISWQEESEIKSSYSSIRSASEEAMTVLEEVIMFTFQQSVYYLTKTLYTALPGLLDSNPFSDSGQLRVPEGVKNILEIFQEALNLLNQYKLHLEITSQLFAYLFFFSNASLFNALMERGSGGGFYQWSKGVQIRANLDLLLDWIQGIGLGDLAAEFFQTLSSAVNFLATPKENLLQANWRILRNEFVNLNPAQLHHMLREYNPGRPCPPGWSPTLEDLEAALRTDDILESFDNHPPLILPCSNFQLGLDKPVNDQSLQQHLKQIQEFLQSLKESPADADHCQKQVKTAPKDGNERLTHSTECTKGSTICAEDHHTVLSTPGTADHNGKDFGITQSVLPSAQHDFSGAVLTQKLKNLELQSNLPGQQETHKKLALDPSCLLTPPNTPQTLELAEVEADQLEGPCGRLLNGNYTEAKVQYSHSPKEKTTVDHSHNCCLHTSEMEEDEVFTVELEREPHGLGLALIDGLKTPLNMNGIYIKSLVPDSPAAKCQKLQLGDRILAINGTSLVGMDYSSGRDLIRKAGGKLCLLVARSEPKVALKISASRC